MSDRNTPITPFEAQRAAVQRHRQQVIVAMRTYRPGRQMEARVLVDGKYYDVDPRQLERLESGVTPEILDLEPVDGD